MDWSVAIVPLSHISGLGLFNPAKVVATRIWYAVCFAPRRASFTYQEKRGFSTSSPIGLSRYSTRRWVGGLADWAMADEGVIVRRVIKQRVFKYSGIRVFRKDRRQ